jgi:hypothetical protein
MSEDWAEKENLGAKINFFFCVIHEQNRTHLPLQKVFDL